MQNFRDYYEILGIAQNADTQSIKRAYRRLARQFHPDLNPGNQEAEERFKGLGEAYEILSDATHKAQYDEYRLYWLQQKSAADYQDLEDFDRFVDQLLNRQSVAAKESSRPQTQTQTQNPRQERRDAEASLQIPLERAFHGGTERIRLEDGRALEVDMPPRMVTGQRLRLRGQGMNGGDLYLNIAVEPHHFLTIQGQDVVCYLPITPSEAVLGGQITIPTLDGPVQMTIPAGIQPGRKLRLAGKGYGILEKERGDQIVEIGISIPREISEQEAELYEKLNAVEFHNPRAHLY